MAWTPVRRPWKRLIAWIVPIDYTRQGMIAAMAAMRPPNGRYE